MDSFKGIVEINETGINSDKREDDEDKQVENESERTQ